MHSQKNCRSQNILLIKMSMEGGQNLLKNSNNFSSYVFKMLETVRYHTVLYLMNRMSDLTNSNSSEISIILDNFGIFLIFLFVNVKQIILTPPSNF